jgi:hypothetical protein
MTAEPAIDTIMKANYIVYHLNHSLENENLPILAKYGFPQRFGFPVFIVLDGKGNLIHIQDAYLLSDRSKVGFGDDLILEFLNNWTPSKLDPAKYEEKIGK